MRSYAKVWVDAYESGQQITFYQKKSDAPNQQFVTPLWIEFAYPKSTLVLALNRIHKLTFEGIKLDADQVAVGTDLITYRSTKRPRKN